jgi:rhodanese-related sulfurtransferase
VRSSWTDRRSDSVKEDAVPTSILRDEVQRLIAEADAQLVEVLPAPEYEDAHIVGAINIPLRVIDRETTAVLDRARPVIVY